MKKIFLMLLILPIMQSCFGGSGSDTNYSDLTVNYVYPEDGATNIYTNHKFILNFDQPVKRNQVLYNVSITKDDGSNVAYSFDEASYDAKYTFVLVPGSVLDPGTDYTLTIKEGLLSDTKGKLKQNQSRHFTTSTEYGTGQDYTTPYEDISKSEFTKEVIILYFVEHLNPLHIDDQSVYLTTEYGIGDKINSTVVYDFINRCIIITPDVPLESGDYEAVYYGGIEDLAEFNVGGAFYCIAAFSL